MEELQTSSEDVRALFSFSLDVEISPTWLRGCSIVFFRIGNVTLLRIFSRNGNTRLAEVATVKDGNGDDVDDDDVEFVKRRGECFYYRDYCVQVDYEPLVSATGLWAMKNVKLAN